MAKRTIKAVYYQWQDDNGTYRVDRMGTEIDVPEGYYLERGDKLGMFVETAPDLVEPVLSEPTIQGEPAPAVVPTIDDGKVLSFDEVAEQNGPEVVAYVKGHPETAEGVLAAETSESGKNRSTVVAELTKLIEG